MLRYSLLFTLAMSALPSVAAADALPLPQLQQAVSRGDIVPLRQLLNWVESRYHGEIVAIELEEEAGQGLVYSISLLGQDGQRALFHFNAANGEILRMEGVDLAQIRKP
jgi:uncharacterized membrane protein YkoI